MKATFRFINRNDDGDMRQSAPLSLCGSEWWTQLSHTMPQVFAQSDDILNRYAQAAIANPTKIHANLQSQNNSTEGKLKLSTDYTLSCVRQELGCYPPGELIHNSRRCICRPDYSCCNCIFPPLHNLLLHIEGERFEYLLSPQEIVNWC